MSGERKAMPISPTLENTSFPNLLEDVDQVRTNLDLLGLPYNPNDDHNADRVTLVIKRIIDESPDVEITFEKNSLDKTSKSNAQKTAYSVDLTGETSSSEDAKGVIKLFDQDRPSPIVQAPPCKTINTPLFLMGKPNFRSKS